MGGKALIVCHGGQGKKPEVSELPSCEGCPHRIVTLSSAALSQRAQSNPWGRATAHHAQDYLARQPGEEALKTQVNSSNPKHPLAGWVGPP